MNYRTIVIGMNNCGSNCRAVGRGTAIVVPVFITILTMAYRFS